MNKKPKIITFASWKGGTGKTTLAAASIKNLALQGNKILVIDIDSNLSTTVILKKVKGKNNSIDLLNGDLIGILESNKTELEGVDLIPSDLRIGKINNLSERTIKHELEKLDLSSYDYVFIDPPGTMNALTRSAIKAADKVIIPAKPSMIDFEATELIIKEMCLMDVDADVSIVVNEFDPKKNVDGIVNLFSETYEDLFYNKPITLMKSLRNLTNNFFKYSISGIAKRNIDEFVSEVIK